MTNSTITFTMNPDRDTQWDSYIETSIRLYDNPKGREKILKTLQKSRYRFDFHIIPDAKLSRIPHTNNPTGDFKGNPDAITSIITNNVSNDNRPLTAWMMVHRFGHAVQIREHHGNHYSKHSARDIKIIMPIIDLYNRHYDPVYIRIDGPFTKISGRETGYWPANEQFAYFINNLLTMRSARNNEIGARFGTDGFSELLAQFVINGRVRFNRIGGYAATHIEEAERSVNRLLERLMDNLQGSVLVF